ncbi:hypothetical protein [Nostoc punctiforme]|uniref:hypothetical protein n=1 Tax=Nostoc punctiforme TaxID=272131 RepID=UPI000045BD30|nr:hypothetical protein [Nostoc punctiforme]
MITSITNSKNWLKVITSQWLPNADYLSLKQLQKTTKELSDRQVEIQKSLERIELEVSENTQVLNFIAQHLMNQ